MSMVIIAVAALIAGGAVAMLLTVFGHLFLP